MPRVLNGLPESFMEIIFPAGTQIDQPSSQVGDSLKEKTAGNHDHKKLHFGLDRVPHPALDL